MKDKLHEMPPKRVINSMGKEAGGALNVQESSDDPQNRSQLCNLNCTVQRKPGRRGAHMVTDFSNIMKMSTRLCMTLNSKEETQPASRQTSNTYLMYRTFVAHL